MTCSKLHKIIFIRISYTLGFHSDSLIYNVTSTVLYTFMNLCLVKILLKNFHLNGHELEIYLRFLARLASWWGWKLFKEKEFKILLLVLMIRDFQLAGHQLVRSWWKICAWMFNNESGLPQNKRISHCGGFFWNKQQRVPLLLWFVIGFAMSRIRSGETTASHQQTSCH